MFNNSWERYLTKLPDPFALSGRAVSLEYNILGTLLAAHALYKEIAEGPEYARNTSEQGLPYTEMAMLKMFACMMFGANAWERGERMSSANVQKLSKDQIEAVLRAIRREEVHCKYCSKGTAVLKAARWIHKARDDDTGRYEKERGENGALTIRDGTDAMMEEEEEENDEDDADVFTDESKRYTDTGRMRNESEDMLKFSADERREVWLYLARDRVQKAINEIKMVDVGLAETLKACF